MTGKVLILNQDYSALTVCGIKKAFLLLWLEKAETISSSNSSFLRTISRSFPAPSVIRLNNYVKFPYKGVVLTRQNIYRRDRHSCVYCGKHENLTLDHVLPKSRGGASTWDNLVTACKTCNAKKGDYTPEEAKMPLQKRPFKPSFIMFLKNFVGTPEEDWLPYLFQKRMA